MMASTIAWAGIFSSVRERSVAFHIAPRSGIVPDGVMIWSPATLMSPMDRPCPGTAPGPGPGAYPGAGGCCGIGSPAPPTVGWCAGGCG
ncbi:hypothetical protein CG724_15775 [Streptomyces sp. CB02120-2]|nr:hypothetical protein CG724_15775 [Streptomyces sp. CB02120-2]